MTAPILTVRSLVKRFGGLLATDHVDLTVEPGEIHALIGPNGAGKTTLMSQLMGEIPSDMGTVEIAGRPVDGMSTAGRVKLALARTFQITCLLPQNTVLENVALAVQIRRGHSFHFWRDVRGDRSLHDEAGVCLGDVGLEARAQELVANLSHGEQRQLELAVALATRPRLLLLDEPMAGLGPAETSRMVELLRGLKSRVSMLLVEHDMEAVFALADRISVLVCGRIIASGAAEAIRENPEVQKAYLGEGELNC